MLKVITYLQAVLGGPSCIEKLAPRLFARSVRNACPDLFIGLQTTHSFSLHPYMRQDRCWLAVFDLTGVLLG